MSRKWTMIEKEQQHRRMLGRKVSEETTEKQRLAHLKYESNLTEEEKEVRNQSRLIEQNRPEVKEKKSQSMMGHEFSDETIEKIRQSMMGKQNALGYVWTEEAKEMKSQSVLEYRKNERWVDIANQFADGKPIKDWLVRPSTKLDWRDPNKEWCLNEWFKNSELHHFSKHVTGYISIKIHKSVFHWLEKGTNMTIINDMGMREIIGKKLLEREGIEFGG